MRLTSARPVRLRGLVLIVVFALVAAVARGQTTTVPAYRARILGVFSAQTGEPVEGAEVIDMLTRTSALTTKTGTVSLAFLTDSGSLVRIQKIGYQPVMQLVAITPKDTVPITVLLSPIATTLPTVVTKDSAPRHVSPGLQAFEERRRAGFGRFITENELRKNDNHNMTSMVRRFPVNIACPRTGFRRGECWAVSSRRGCPVEVYLDGAVSTDNDLEKLKVVQFAAVEFYSGAATIPPQYNKTGSSCGVLLLWTRER